MPTHQYSESPRLVPLGVLASELGVQPAALREAAERGDIPAVRLGARALLFDRAAVEAALLARARERLPETNAPEAAR